ncbi:hypothetical protein MMC26_004820 [Xylographa opegraphella]|nr:hypothetical protein [Xylographa opegraphella]
MSIVGTDYNEAQAEVARLEQALRHARLKLVAAHLPSECPDRGHLYPTSNYLNEVPHALLLISDSALPLGSFAYSSGLESYLAHHKPLAKDTTPTACFQHFLHVSLSSLAGSVLPYVLCSYRNPDTLFRLDNDLDASTICTVARRASVSQGRALLSVWERALRSSGQQGCKVASSHLSSLATALKNMQAQVSFLGPNGHFAPLWALVCRAMGISLDQTTYVFLFNHTKALLGAAVRASVMGPYQAQGVLASVWLQEGIREAMETNWMVKTEDAGQVIPVLDLWIGRHELLYSRIFNS